MGKPFIIGIILEIRNTYGNFEVLNVNLNHKSCAKANENCRPFV